MIKKVVISTWLITIKFIMNTYQAIKKQSIAFFFTWSFRRKTKNMSLLRDGWLSTSHNQNLEDANGETNAALEGVVGDGDNVLNEMNGDVSGEVEDHYCMLRSLSWNFPTISLFHNSNDEYYGVIISDEHLLLSSSSSSIDSKVIEEI